MLAALLAGCGPGKGEVRGTVRYNGKPLPSGTVQFLGADGIPHAGTIQPDGTFAVQVPAGEAKVVVSSVDEAGMIRLTRALTAGRGRAAPPPPSSANYSRIPLRYADWNASGLTVLVERGGTNHDFDLVSR
jgi:hypothetical protein